MNSVLCPSTVCTVFFLCELFTKNRVKLLEATEGAGPCLQK